MSDTDPIAENNVPLTETPEFQAAVAAGIQAALPAVTTQVLAALTEKMAQNAPAAVAGAGSLDLQALFTQMALTMAEVSDQGTDRKRVAPEILMAREKAKDRMGELIMEAREAWSKKGANPADRPRYRLVAKVYFNERLIEPFQRLVDKRAVPTEVFWMGAPNDAMRPINEAAKGIYAEYLTWVGGAGSVMGTQAQPVWLTAQGVVVATPSATAAKHGMMIGGEGGLPDPLSLDDERAVPSPVGGGFADELDFVNQNDPRLSEVAVLGTLAPKAKQTSLGDNIGK